jgi:hypothetical protein
MTMETSGAARTKIGASMADRADPARAGVDPAKVRRLWFERFRQQHADGVFRVASSSWRGTACIAVEEAIGVARGFRTR